MNYFLIGLAVVGGIVLIVSAWFFIGAMSAHANYEEEQTYEIEKMLRRARDRRTRLKRKIANHPSR